MEKGGHCEDGERRAEPAPAVAGERLVDVADGPAVDGDVPRLPEGANRLRVPKVTETDEKHLKNAKIEKNVKFVKKLKNKKKLKKLKKKVNNFF